MGVDCRHQLVAYYSIHSTIMGQILVGKNVFKSGSVPLINPKNTKIALIALDLCYYNNMVFVIKLN